MMPDSKSKKRSEPRKRRVTFFVDVVYDESQKPTVEELDLLLGRCVEALEFPAENIHYMRCDDLPTGVSVVKLTSFGG